MSPPRDPIDRIEQALRDHENKVERRHNDFLEMHSTLRDSVVELATELRRDREHLHNRLENHHKSLYDERDGVVGRVRDIEKRSKWTWGAIAKVSAGALAISSLLIGVLGFVFDRLGK